MKLNYGTYAQIMYRHMIPKPQIYKLTELLLTAALEDGEKIEITSLHRSTRTNYFKCKVDVKSDIKSYYKRAGTYRRVCLHFKDEIIPLLKRPVSELLGDFRELVESDGSIEEELKNGWLELADPKNRIRFLAKVFIYAVQQDNLIEGATIQEKPLSHKPTAIDAVDRLASSAEQRFSSRFQETQNEMLASFMQMAALSMGLTSEEAEEYVSYEGPLENGLPHGSNGKAKYSDGRIYIGDWRFGKRHGRGNLVQPDMYDMDAEWKDDKLDGRASVLSLTESLKNCEQRICYKSGKPHGEGIWKDEFGEAKTFWRSNADGSVSMSRSDKDFTLDFTFNPDGKITIICEDTAEEPHIKAGAHGFYCNTGSMIYLKDGEFSINYGGGETETRKGNLALPDMDLFGIGELTTEGVFGKRYCRGIYINDTLNGFAAATYEDGAQYAGFSADGYQHGWGKITIPSESGEDVYIGQWKHGRRHGRGKATFADGGSYVGQLKNGHHHGRGKRIFSDQSSYEGEWKNDRSHGRGTRIYADGSSYVGQWKNGFPNGLGTKTDANGHVVYAGVWRYGEICGRGTHYRPDGTKSYVGESIDGIPHGRGRELDESETVVYEGEFQNGSYHGRGTKWFPNNEEYVGQWEQGHFHGRGKMVWAHGTYSGEWKNSKPCGRGVFESADGWSYMGEWRDGDAHGFGIRTEADGTEQKGLFKSGKFIADNDYRCYNGDKVDGLPHGYGEYFGPDFSTYKGFWRMGQKHGPGTVIFLNGAVLECEWEDNQIKPGQAKILSYYGDSYEGGITADVEFHGVGRAIEANGKVQDGEWENGSFTGKAEVVYPSSAHISGNWIDGKRNGFCLCIDSDGQVLKGMWRDDHTQDGYFRKIWPSGYVYFGEIEDGLKHGAGKAIDPNSRTLYGIYREGTLLQSGSNGRIIYPNGGSYRGDFFEGKFHGQGRIVYADGAIKSGTWENEKFTGNGPCYLLIPCKAICQGQLINSVLNGRGTLTSLNGDEPYIQSGIWENGVLSGKGKQIFLDGSSYSGLFEEGNPVGQLDATWFDGRTGKAEMRDGKIIFHQRSEPESA